MSCDSGGHTSCASGPVKGHALGKEPRLSIARAAHNFRAGRAFETPAV